MTFPTKPKHPKNKTIAPKPQDENKTAKKESKLRFKNPNCRKSTKLLIQKPSSPYPDCWIIRAVASEKVDRKSLCSISVLFESVSTP